jgi:hypothetical protein
VNCVLKPLGHNNTEGSDHSAVDDRDRNGHFVTIAPDRAEPTKLSLAPTHLHPQQAPRDAGVDVIKADVIKADVIKADVIKKDGKPGRLPWPCRDNYLSAGPNAYW